MLRISGPDALAIAGKMEKASSVPPVSQVQGFHRVSREIHIDDSEYTIPAEFCVFRAPRSYTRDDVVEILTFGAPPVLKLVMEQAIRHGAKLAEPGEFTARAFLNGRLTLSQAEAVAGIIAAQSDSQLRAARMLADGALAVRVQAFSKDLAGLTALVEADIDFAEEPIDFITPEELAARVDSVRLHIDEILADSAASDRINVLPQVLLIGPPNAGKSSLMNRLSQTDRAICAAVAGTTRDILRAPAQIGDQEIMLLDTAGIDETDDEIVEASRALALDASERVDAVCLVLDVHESPPQSLLNHLQHRDLPPATVALNKVDTLTDKGEVDQWSALLRPLGISQIFPTSALTGEGIEQLSRAILALLSVSESSTQREGMLLTQRQKEAMVNTCAALGRASTLAREAESTVDCAEFLAFELRSALHEIGTISGEVTTDDLLGRIFSDFCIGK
jgi:tRNA modification GTPase